MYNLMNKFTLAIHVRQRDLGFQGGGCRGSFQLSPKLLSFSHYNECIM